jgi:hypothetical protein
MYGIMRQTFIERVDYLCIKIYTTENHDLHAHEHKNADLTGFILLLYFRVSNPSARTPTKKSFRLRTSFRIIKINSVFNGPDDGV